MANNLHLQIDLHSHSVASGHAFNTIDELATEAQKVGIKLLGISDHGPSMVGSATPGYFEMGPRLPKVISDIQVWFGCEANILGAAGEIDVPDSAIRILDYLMAGLHARTPYPTGETKRGNTNAVIACIKRHRPLAITHPYTSAFPTEVGDVVKAAADYGVAVEVNLSRLRTNIEKTGGGLEEVRQMSQMLAGASACGGLVLIGSDAHYKSELGASHSELTKFSECLGFDLRLAVNFSADFWIKKEKAFIL